MIMSQWPNADDPGAPESESWTQLVLPVLEQAWQVARQRILNAGLVSAEDMWMLSNPDQMGDPAHEADQFMHQWIAGELMRRIPNVQVAGEESLPSSLLLDPKTFRYIAYVDAIDGSRQAFTLPGCWSINVVIQRYVMTDRLSGIPKCAICFLGIIDAEGVAVTWEIGQPYTELTIMGTQEAPEIKSDQLLLGGGESFGVTGTTTVLAGGYKPKWWAAYEALRTRMPEYPSFNTAGGPVTRKVLQNSDVVTLQLTKSTLWDGLGAGIIAAAGGFVIRLGEAEALPSDNVLDWLSQFGYVRRTDNPTRMVEHYCVPAFVAGMDGDRVLEIADRARDLPSTAS